MSEETKKKYIVKPGFTFGLDMGPGSIVELTEFEAGPFMDKLELYSEKKSSKKSEEDESSAGEPAPKGKK